ncbi:ATP-binding protein [Lactiplantibacillus plajomi]|uniref:AAA family ATPase n=1 Tax=Lactiplantibacillus plajomi TaxID=1457217 RepID=A0ABV6JZK3_9LACO|nr:AAA family ATPase [Lactiplantibacillus plajomi]
MRIKRVEIAGFGKFTQQVFELADGLQVIYGDNESGKSTLRAFILGMLFGFPSRRHPLERYEPQATSQYGGSLDLMVNGTTYRLTRLGDQPAQLIDLATQAAQPLSLLDHWLAPYDLDQYKQLFTFNQAELTALKSLGAQELNRQLQQVGLVGSAPWRTTAASLQHDAEDLYKPRGRKPELNRALHQYRELSAQVEAARVRYPQYQALQTKIATLSDQQIQYQQTLKTLTDQQQRLANLRNQWPVYQQLQQLQAQTPRTAQTLTPATVKRTQDLLRRQTELQPSLTSARQQLSQQPVDDQSRGLLGFYVQHQTEFEALEAQLPTLQQAYGQYQALTDQVTQAQRDLSQQQAAHPELVACLAPERQDAVRTLRTTVANWQPQSRQQHQQQRQIDWRLIAGGIAVVAGLFLPLGAFKWVLALAGFGLVGWFGYDEFNQPAVATATPQPDLEAQLRAAGLAAELDVNDARSALEQLTALQRAQAAVTSAEQHATTQAGRVWQSLQAYRFATAWIPVAQAQLAQSVQRVQRFYTDVHQLLQKQGMAGPDFAYTQRQVQQLTEQLRSVANQLQQLAEDNGLADVDELTAAIDAQDMRQTNVTAAEQLQRQLANDYADLQRYPNLAALQAEIGDVRQRLTATQQALTSQTADLVSAQTELRHLTEDGRYAELRQQQANLQTTITVLARRWLTRQLGARWIETALQRLTDQQLPAVLQRATTNFARLTLARYNKINLDGNQLVVTTIDGSRFDAAALSTATKEQLYLAIRLALISHLGAGATLPLMIDDGLVNFDADRRQAAWALLTEIAQEHQLIYFTNEPAARTQFADATVLDLA